MRFGKCMGTLWGHRGSFIWGLGFVWGTYGAIGVVYIMFGKCMRTLGGHRGRLCEVWEVYGDPRGS